MYEIAVIGCGIMGLTSALEIQRRCKNVNVTIFTKAKSPNTTSDIAAGLWGPYLLKKTPPKKILQWSGATYEYLLKMWREGKAAEAGICLQPFTYTTKDENFQLPEYLKNTLGYTELTQEELEPLGTRYGVKFTGGFVYPSFTWEGTTSLPYLEKEFLQNGGHVIIKKIFSIKELSHFDVVVNCTGIDAKELVGDNLLTPFRGQVMRVSSPWAFHCYVIDDDKSGYILPNTNFTVIGGTKQVDWSREVDETDSKKIITNCKEILPSIESVTILEETVGLRPGRESVRLEVEIEHVGDKELPIVHNYGHGGSGITLSIGCAQETAELVDNVLNKNMRSKL